MKMKITLAQTHVHYGDFEANVNTVQDAVHLAAQQGSDLVLVPELWSSGYDLENSDIYAPKNALALSTIKNLIEKHSISFGGTLIEDGEDGNLYNIFSLLQPGQPKQTYRKIHLFRLINEHHTFSPGESPVIVDLGGEAVGLATCYDLRFPELFRYYGVNGTRLILLSAEWPITRIHHWKTLLQARAIENQCFVAGVNCVGQSGDLDYGGSSMLISPMGDVILEASSSKEELLTANIDLQEADKARKFIPVFGDRRPDTYTG